MSALRRYIRFVETGDGENPKKTKKYYVNRIQIPKNPQNLRILGQFKKYGSVNQVHGNSDEGQIFGYNEEDTYYINPDKITQFSSSKKDKFCACVDDKFNLQISKAEIDGNDDTGKKIVPQMVYVFGDSIKPADIELSSSPLYRIYYSNGKDCENEETYHEYRFDIIVITEELKEEDKNKLKNLLKYQDDKSIFYVKNGINIEKLSLKEKRREEVGEEYRKYTKKII